MDFVDRRKLILLVDVSPEDGTRILVGCAFSTGKVGTLGYARRIYGQDRLL
jgi:Flp pilus assembly protein TadD